MPSTTRQAKPPHHSRYLLAFEPCRDVTMASAFDVLWTAFAFAGLPEQVLCDNAFSTMGTAHPAGLSWFDARLIRLGIRPSHGRPYHPAGRRSLPTRPRARSNGCTDRASAN